MLTQLKKFGEQFTGLLKPETISNQPDVQEWLCQHFLSEKIQVAKTNFAYEISGESTILEKLHKIIQKVDGPDLTIVIDKQDRKFTKKDTQLAAATFLKPLDVFTRVLMTVDAVGQVYHFIDEKVCEYKTNEYQAYLKSIAESRKVPLENVILEIASDVDLQLKLQENCTRYNDTKQVVIDTSKSPQDDKTENFDSISVQEVITRLLRQFPSSGIQYSKTKLGYEISAQPPVLEKLMEDLKKIDEYELSIVVTAEDRKFKRIDIMQADVLFVKPSDTYIRVLVTATAFKYLHQLIEKNKLIEKNTVSDNQPKDIITEKLELTALNDNQVSDNQPEDKITEKLELMTLNDNIVDDEFPYNHPTNCSLQ